MNSMYVVCTNSRSQLSYGPGLLDLQAVQPVDSLEGVCARINQLLVIIIFDVFIVVFVFEVFVVIIEVVVIIFAVEIKLELLAA